MVWRRETMSTGGVGRGMVEKTIGRTGRGTGSESVTTVAMQTRWGKTTTATWYLAAFASVSCSALIAAAAHAEREGVCSEA